MLTHAKPLLPPANEVPPWAGTIPSPGRYTSWAGTPPSWVGTPPGRYTPLGRYTPRQVHPPGRYTPPAGQVHTPPAVRAGIRSTSGQYASYFNAYLLSQIILHEKVILKHSPAKFTIVPVVTHHLTDRFGTHSVRQCKFDSPAPLCRDPRHRHVRTCALWLTSWWLASYLNVFLLFMQFAGS